MAFHKPDCDHIPLIKYNNVYMQDMQNSLYNSSKYAHPEYFTDIFKMQAVLILMENSFAESNKRKGFMK